MPTTCIVPTCQSGYKKNDNKSLSFFVVPRNKKLRKLWENIMGKHNLKDHHRVCSRHFLEKDVLWRRELIHNGKIVGVSPLTKPKLREGSIPRKYVKNKAKEVIQQEILLENGQLEAKIKSNDSHNLEGTNPQVFIENNSEEAIKQDEILLENGELKVEIEKNDSHNLKGTNPQVSIENNSEEVIKQEEILLEDNQLEEEIQEEEILLENGELEVKIEKNDNHNLENNKNMDCVSETDETVQEQYSLEKIFNIDVSLPIGWAKNIYHYENKRVAIYCKYILKNINESFGTINSKEILVNENLEIAIKVFHRNVDLNLLKIGKNIANRDELERILQLIENLNVCIGCSITDELKKVNTSVIISDCTNTKRHRNCHLLTQSVRCICCIQGKRSLMRKYLRLSSQSNAIRQIPTEISPVVKKYLHSLANEMLKKFRRKIRSLECSKLTLLAKLMNCRNKIATIRKESLEQSLQKCDLNKTVLSEIVNASKCKSNGIDYRYSEDWLMLCILLHMESSQSYEFLRSNKILPLPSLTTIKR